MQRNFMLLSLLIGCGMVVQFFDSIKNTGTLIHQNTFDFFTTLEKSAKNSTAQERTVSKDTNAKKVSLVFLTYSSWNHRSALLLDHLPSIEKWVLNATTPTFIPTLEGESAPTKADLSIRVIHYDLDPVEQRAMEYNNATMQEARHKFPFVEFREFDYEPYPSYFNINIRKGQYAFKPVIVEQVARELLNMDATSNGIYSQSYLYLLDAGVKIEDGSSPFLKDFQIAKKQGIYTPASEGTLREWTVQGTADYLGLDHEIYISPKTRIGSGGIVLLDLKNQTIYDTVIKPWMTCAKVKECIAPQGSSKRNHRQDQSALSVILNKNHIHIHNETGSIGRGRQ